KADRKAGIAQHVSDGVGTGEAGNVFGAGDEDFVVAAAAVVVDAAEGDGIAIAEVDRQRVEAVAGVDGDRIHAGRNETSLVRHIGSGARNWISDARADFEQAEQRVYPDTEGVVARIALLRKDIPA